MSTQKRKYELKARAESQQATRERIAGAASALHEEVGVGKTTVADIARRAGVQRLTVYNHFPDLDALLPACTAHYLRQHPRPDLAPAFAAATPTLCAGSGLTNRYGSGALMCTKPGTRGSNIGQNAGNPVALIAAIVRPW